MSSGRGKNTRIDALAQMVEEGFRVESGSDHGRRKPLRARQAAAAGLAQEKYAVEDSGNAVQLGVQIDERAALAGHVDQVGGAAVQDELIDRR